MLERIIASDKLYEHINSAGFKTMLPYHDIYSADLRDVVHTEKTFEDARKWLERELKRERLACPTGGCED